MQFIVMQEPRSKYRGGLVITVVITEAASKAEAIRKTANNFAGPDKMFSKPVAKPLHLDMVYSI